jgi:hypothetical protein
LTYGRLGAFLLKWSIWGHFSQAKNKRMSWQKYSKCLVLRMSHHGRDARNCRTGKTTNLISMIQFHSTKSYRDWIKKELICWVKCCNQIQV